MSDRKRPRNRSRHRENRKAFSGLKLDLDASENRTVHAVRIGIVTANRACDGKMSYSRKWAEIEAAAMRRDKRDNRFHAYPCPFCGRFHVGKAVDPVTS
jgi:hypothetical protein